MNISNTQFYVYGYVTNQMLDCRNPRGSHPLQTPLQTRYAPDGNIYTYIFICKHNTCINTIHRYMYTYMCLCIYIYPLQIWYVPDGNKYVYIYIYIFTCIHMRIYVYDRFTLLTINKQLPPTKTNNRRA